MTVKFVPPTTYEEAYAFFGQPVLFEDGTVRKAQGCGKSGSPGYPGYSFSLSFEDGSIWTLTNGFETKEGRAIRLWMAGFEALKPEQKELVTKVFPSALERADKDKLKTPDKLVLAALQKLVNAKVIEPATCGRCGGSGRYSYNQMDGDRCYGCQGRKVVFPKVKDALKAMKVKGA